MGEQRMTYAGAGVDIEAGDAAVARMKAHLKRTHGPSVLGLHGAFAGMMRLQPEGAAPMQDPVLVACCDGVGTKIKLAVQLGVHDTIGRDCVAMNVNDLIVQGARPLMFLDYVGVHQVVPEQMEQIVKGVADGCELAGCALLGGETSEMPDVYADGDYDLAGFAVGVVDRAAAIEGPERVSAGDVVLGLASSGIHSNGYTLARKIVAHGELSIDRPFTGDVSADRTLGQAMLEPTRIYARSITALLEACGDAVHGMAHITGGGLPGNLNRSLPDHLDAVLEPDTWTVPPLFELLREQGSVETSEMFRVFNMGIGFCVIMAADAADAAVDALERAGEAVHRIGRVVDGGSGRVRGLPTGGAA